MDTFGLDFIMKCVVFLIVDAFWLTLIRKWVINGILIRQCVVFLIVDAFWLALIRKWVVDACLAYFD